MKKLNNCRYKITWTFIAASISLASVGQNETITRYTDSNWKRVSADSAFYFTEMVKEDNLYMYKSYWMKSKKLNCESTYLDTLFQKRIGRLLRYYENGQTEDSTYFHGNGAVKETYHYYQNGKLAVDYKYDLNTKEDITNAYDEDGNRIKDFIYIRESSFPGGMSGWQDYLARKVDAKVGQTNGAPAARYYVVAQFIVGTDGKVKDVEALTRHGYGMEEEFIRVIKNSPKWQPAIYMGKKVNSYKKQPIYFTGR